MHPQSFVSVGSRMITESHRLKESRCGDQAPAERLVPRAVLYYD